MAAGAGGRSSIFPRQEHQTFESAIELLHPMIVFETPVCSDPLSFHYASRNPHVDNDFETARRRYLPRTQGTEGDLALTVSLLVEFRLRALTPVD
jgi:hypothetical protein